MRKVHLYMSVLFIVLVGCDSNESLSDAFGNFEAEPVMVSSQSQGKLIFLDIEEGMQLEADELIGASDTVLLHLQKVQLFTARQSLAAKAKIIEAQVAAQQVHIDNLQREFNRIQRLLEGEAATQKQADDVAGNIALLEAQKSAQESQKSSILAEMQSVDVQLMQINEQIIKAQIFNPVSGIVLQKYKRYGELVAPGQPIYKVADLQFLFLRAYISGSQLANAVIGQDVTVRFDSGGEIAECPGTITWISDKAEFTPKLIQTREERVNLVYAMKVKVKNDGRLKIGMPGEVVL